jgi:hypothetical protein
MSKRRKSGSGDEAYYYAGGERIDLTPAADLLAVDEEKLSGKEVSESVRSAVEKAARSRMSGIALVHRADLGDRAAAVEEALTRAGALQPVFQAGGATLVALPEVRVEETRAGTQRRLERWLESHAESATVESRGEERIVLKAASGYGGDALKIANELAEAVGPEMAQPRFLRLTAKPSPTKP